MEQTLKLQNGLEMPVLGYGCSFGNWTDTSKWMGFEPEAAWSAIPAALRAGVRHFDAALFYDSQRVLGHCLGQALQKGELRRSDVWITTKVGDPMLWANPWTGRTQISTSNRRSESKSSCALTN